MEVANYKSEQHDLILPSAYLVIRRKTITPIPKFEDIHRYGHGIGLQNQVTQDNFTPGHLVTIEVSVYASEEAYQTNKLVLHDRSFTSFFAGTEPSASTIQQYLEQAVL